MEEEEGGEGGWSKKTNSRKLTFLQCLSMFTPGKRKLCLTTVGIEPSKPKIAGSIPTVVKQSFRLPSVNILRELASLTYTFS